MTVPIDTPKRNERERKCQINQQSFSNVSFIIHLQRNSYSYMRDLIGSFLSPWTKWYFKEKELKRESRKEKFVFGARN